MPLSNAETAVHQKSQAEIQKTASFLHNYFELRQNNTSTVNCYDSCVAEAEKDPSALAQIPQTLIDIFDSVGADGRSYILGAIESGVKAYQRLNGGEMPRPDMVAAALTTGKAALAYDGYDSASGGTLLSGAGMESNSVVPAQTIVAISMQIANAIPLVAYLPNLDGSNEVPIVYSRNIAINSIGEVREKAFLDGASAPRQYFDPQYEFLATKDGVTATKYTLSPTVAYKDINERTPDPASKPLAFMGGRVRVLVNGVEVANDAHTSHSKFEGQSTLIPLPKHGLVVKDALGADVVVIVASGTANLDNNTVEINFVNELPDTAEVTVNVIADYERKNGDVPVLAVPSVDIDLVARTVMAYPMRAKYRATDSAINQMQNELKVDVRGAITAIVTSKFMLEQNIRLLKTLKRRAMGFGRTLKADLSRGSTDTPIFNNTSEQARELLVTISRSKVMINRLLDVIPSGHDIYVTDKMSILFDNLADDTHYRKISSAVGSPNNITRIGVIDGGINVYHVPEDSGLLSEIDDTAEIMVVGRSADAVRNPFVGFITQPLTVKESRVIDFESGVTIQAIQAAEVNPLERFADQAVVILVTELPASIVAE